MILDRILEITPDFNFEENITFKTVIDQSDNRHEVRDCLIDSGIREFKIKLSYRSSENINSLWDFFISRSADEEDFLIKVITQFQAVDEPVATGDGSTRQFLLHNFPVDADDNHSAKIDGVANIDYVITNDTANECSYITFNTAPALSSAVTVSYEFYVRVRFSDSQLSRELFNYKLFNVGLELTEVRWNTYYPYSGNSSSSSSSSSMSISTSTKWFAVSGAGLWTDAYTGWDGESQVFQSQLPRFQTGVSKLTTEFIIRRMVIYLTIAPGFNKKRKFTIYRNDEKTTMSVTISGSNKTADVSNQIICSNNDYIYIREDETNSPAATQLSIGISVATNDPRKCPILGIDNQAYAPLLDNLAYGDGGLLSSYQGQLDNLLYHSLITTPGYLLNLQARNEKCILPGYSVESHIIKKVGSDKLYKTDLDVTVEGIGIDDENINDSVYIDVGDFVGFGADIFTAYQHMASLDFIPDNDNESNHSLYSNGFNTPSIDATATDAYTCFHGFASFKQRSLLGFGEAFGYRDEPFTVFPLSGTVKNITIVGRNGRIFPDSPATYVIRKNGLDTSLQGSLTSTIRSVVIDGCIDISAGDRLSVAVRQVAQPATSSGGSCSVHIAWTFVSDDAGEWPLFLTLMTS